MLAACAFMQAFKTFSSSPNTPVMILRLIRLIRRLSDHNDAFSQNLDFSSANLVRAYGTWVYRLVFKRGYDQQRETVKDLKPI
jgi:hypothetical protein